MLQSTISTNREETKSTIEVLPSAVDRAPLHPSSSFFSFVDSFYFSSSLIVVDCLYCAKRDKSKSDVCEETFKYSKGRQLRDAPWTRRRKQIHLFMKGIMTHMDTSILSCNTHCDVMMMRNQNETKNEIPRVRASDLLGLLCKMQFLLQKFLKSYYKHNFYWPFLELIKVMGGYSRAHYFAIRLSVSVCARFLSLSLSDFIPRTTSNNHDNSRTWYVQINIPQCWGHRSYCIAREKERELRVKNLEKRVSSSVEASASASCERVYAFAIWGATHRKRSSFMAIRIIQEDIDDR